MSEHVEGLTPVLIPAKDVEETYLVCGLCGYVGFAESYIHVDGPEIFSPVCRCPLPATLAA